MDWVKKKDEGLLEKIYMLKIRESDMNFNSCVVASPTQTAHYMDRVCLGKRKRSLRKKEQLQQKHLNNAYTE